MNTHSKVARDRKQGMTAGEVANFLGELQMIGWNPDTTIVKAIAGIRGQIQELRAIHP